MAGELTERVIELAIEVPRRTGPDLLDSVREQSLGHEPWEAVGPPARQAWIPAIDEARRHTCRRMKSLHPDPIMNFNAPCLPRGHRPSWCQNELSSLLG